MFRKAIKIVSQLDIKANLVSGRRNICSHFAMSESNPKIPRRSMRLNASKLTASINRFVSSENFSASVQHDKDASEFFIDVPDKGRAYLEYERNNNIITIKNTEVPEELEGRGLGKLLAKEALQFVAVNDLQLSIECEFVRYFVSKYEPKYIKYIKDHDYASLVLYYGRVKFFHSMQKAALDGLAKFPMMSCFRLFNGFALVLGNRIQEGIRELNPLKNDRDFDLAAVVGLVFAHKRCNVLDKDALQMLEQRLQNEYNLPNSSAAYYAAVFLFLSGNMKKAREYSLKALKLDEQNGPAAVLKAWSELDKASLSGNLLHAFERNSSQGKNIDAALGQVKYFQLCGQFDNAINTLNKLSVRFPELNIPLIEKMETNLAALDWDNTFETAQRIVNLDPTNIAALQVKALVLLGREGNIKIGLTTLQQLLASTERVEVGNNDLLLQICKLFRRVCSHQHDAVSLTLRCVEKMTQVNAANVAIITELGYQHLTMGKTKEAEHYFHAAINIDSNYFFALCGLASCQTLQNYTTEQKYQQVEFLEELHCSDQEATALILFLRAKITEQSDRAVALLIKATEIHLRQLESLTFGVEYIRLLNPEFLLQIAAELMLHSPVPTFVNVGSNLVHITLKHCISILDAVLHLCPGHCLAIFMRARVDFLCGHLSKASLTLQRILNDIDVTLTDAHLLLAQVHMRQNQFTKAMQVLEVALSHNFAVRDNPMYHLLLGILQKQQQQLTDAQRSFLAALQLLGSAFLGTEQQLEDHNAETLVGFTMADKVTLYLELIKTLREMNDTQGTYESERLLQVAMEEFSNTPEEGRLVIANAEFMVHRYNISKAISLLGTLQPDQPYYIQAKTQLANIYLQHRKDRVTFAKCFEEMVDACPETESFLILGEAYMSIQEPDLAVSAYQRALNVNPNDSLLASKLGRAYVKTHQYARAIKYYQEALKNPDHSGLKLDLAELFLKLKQYQNAIDVLNEDLEQTKIAEEDVADLELRTKELMLLARVYEKSGNIASSLQTLREARDNQYRVQNRFTVDQSGNLSELGKTLSKICLLMAQQSISLRDNDQALRCFKECLKHTPNDIEILSAMARLYMQINSIELCRDVCMQILQIDGINEVASVMMADLSFRKMEFDNAAFHFSQLLISKPCYWTALARLIEVMRRSGTLSEVNPFLHRAEQSTAMPNHTQGLNYCKGLYEWYSGNPNVALRHFNAARRDHEWGQQAIFNMIEICINPDGEVLSVSEMQDAVDSVEYSDSRMIALRTAERLLKELHPRPPGMNNEALNHRLLHNFLQLASKQKFHIESALQDFTLLATREEYQNMVGPVFGMASALVMLKQVQRAKNHLKRFVRLAWNFEEAEYFERSWLLLADIYIHANKLDVAESVVDRVLEHNKSSNKAYELAGFIAEKAQVFRDAAKHYHSAWNCGGRSKPHIGYKLAYNYMKMKQYAEAIDVCQQVIKLHPDYVIIRKDILNKCRSNLKS